VRPAGEEVRAGERLAAPGDTVTPPLLALLAATGASSLPVHPSPSVALLVTGDELVSSGEPEAIARGIRRTDVLSPTLPEFLRQAGGTPLEPVRVGDDLQEIGRALAHAAALADFIVTTGGASMGEADLVKRALDAVGFDLDFWRVRMRPGSPVSFGKLRAMDRERPVPVLGLPGNPVSAMVTFLTLGAPAVRRLGGHSRLHLPSVRATAREALRGHVDLRTFLRVTLEGEGGGRWGARLSAPQGSGAIRNLALADGLAVLPEGVDSIREGEGVAVLLLPHFGWSSNT
jgi:molybdopterin molybdotransferase